MKIVKQIKNRFANILKTRRESFINFTNKKILKLITYKDFVTFKLSGKSINLITLIMEIALLTPQCGSRDTDFLDRPYLKYPLLRTVYCSDTNLRRRRHSTGYRHLMNYQSRSILDVVATCRTRTRSVNFILFCTLLTFFVYRKYRTKNSSTVLFTNVKLY